MTTISTHGVAYLALVPLFIWLYILLGRGLFWWLTEDLQEFESPELPRWPRIVAVVPARNETKTIAQTVASLAAQDYPGEFRIVIVDDHSTDHTAQFALNAATESGAATRVTVHAAQNLEPGWTGKLWALQQGVELGSKISPEYFWFTDADIVHSQTRCAA